MKSKILSGSFILLIGFGVFNILNLGYQFAMARILSLSDISILATLFSLVYIFAIFSESLQTIVAKYSSSTNGDRGKLKDLLKRFIRKSRRIGLYFLMFYLCVSVILSWILSINYILLALNGLILYLMFLLPVTRGAMQGCKNFKALSWNLIIESGLKLTFSIIFVLLGWKIYGAIGGFVLGTVVAFIVSFIPLKKIYESNQENIDVGNINLYALGNSIIIALIILFYSVDVIFARWMFSPEIAGTYAIASLLGKIILWASIPIGKAMFPLTAETIKGSNEDKKVFRGSLKILIAITALTVIFMTIFSKQVINLFYGRELTEAITILPYLVIAFSLIAFSNIIFLYQISKGIIKNRYRYLLLLVIIIEFALFYFMKDNLRIFSIGFVISAIFLFVISLFCLKDRHI